MKKICSIIILFLVLYSCDNTIQPTTGLDDFEVTVFNSNVTVGQEVVFSFNSNPDIIYFYSDEMYHQYEYRNGRILGLESIDLSFDTAFPSKSDPQENQFSVMISTNYIDTGNEYDDIVS